MTGNLNQERRGASGTAFPRGAWERDTASSGLLLGALVVVLILVGCRQDMHDQPRIEPLEAHAFFADGMGARQLPAGTVARGMLQEDSHLYTGKDESGAFVSTLPAGIELNREFLERGQNRFDIYCGVCHDSTGGGRGMIVRRGFKQPQPYSEQRLLDMPLGYFFDVMTQGYGVMSSYAKQVPVEDRWAIAAYIRVLQSRTQYLDDLPAAEQTEFREALLQRTQGQAHDTPEEVGHHD